MRDCISPRAYALLRDAYAPYVGLFAVALAIAQAAAARLLWRVDARGALLSAGAAWVILILAAPIQFAGYRVTVIWAAEAAAMAWIGVRLGERRAVLRRHRRCSAWCSRAWHSPTPRMYAGAARIRSWS